LKESKFFRIPNYSLSPEISWLYDTLLLESASFLCLHWPTSAWIVIQSLSSSSVSLSRLFARNLGNNCCLKNLHYPSQNHLKSAVWRIFLSALSPAFAPLSILFLGHLVFLASGHARCFSLNSYCLCNLPRKILLRCSPSTKYLLFIPFVLSFEITTYWEGHRTAVSQSLDRLPEKNKSKRYVNLL
jgi:hypothetical protein